MAILKDSGERTTYESGAVRDCKEGKGRFDLMPMDVLYSLSGCMIFHYLDNYKQMGTAMELINAIHAVQEEYPGECFDSVFEMFLDVSKHFEDGAVKYGENNWQKGIPIHSYIDSACRHYCKHRLGMDDEPHLRACIWNLMCATWTTYNHPELDDFSVKFNKDSRDKSIINKEPTRCGGVKYEC